uniref:PEP-CTERM sorting domain-containing protein n=1 Tax=Halostella sp. PRR32 TaxID=3098147 RepID=UPI002B1D8FAA
LIHASGAVKSDGDYHLDGRVDGADFLGWQKQFGSGTPPVAAIPEPASLALLTIASLACVALRMRRS